MGLVRTAQRTVGGNGLRAPRHVAPFGAHPGRAGRVLDQAHLIEAMDKAMRRLGGTARVWRTDRLASVIKPGTSNVQASFAPVAKHYGRSSNRVRRRGNRKGSVESSVRFCSGRWWRTLSAKDPESAQISLDRFLATTGDGRPRRGLAGERTTVGALADAEPLMTLPWAPYPATICVERTVADNATVAFRGNRYSVPPGLVGSVFEVRHRLSTQTLEIHSPSGAHPARSPRSGATGIGDLATPPRQGTTPHSRSLCSPPSPRRVRVTERPTVHRGPRRWPKRRACSAPTAATSSSTWRLTPSWWR